MFAGRAKCVDFIKGLDLIPAMVKLLTMLTPQPSYKVKKTGVGLIRINDMWHPSYTECRIG